MEETSVQSIEVAVLGLAGEICRVTVPIGITLDAFKSTVRMELQLPQQNQFGLIDNGVPLYDKTWTVSAQGPQQVNLIMFNAEVADWISRLERGYTAHVLRLAPREILDNEYVVSTAMTYGGYALRHLPWSMRGNRGVVMIAVQQYGLALKHATKYLRADFSIVFAAVRQNNYALRFAAKRLRGDIAILKEVVHRDHHNLDALWHSTKTARTDPIIMFELTYTNPEALKYAGDQLQFDKSFLREAVRIPGAIQYVDTAMRNDKEVALVAMKADGLGLQYLSKELQADYEAL